MYSSTLVGEVRRVVEAVKATYGEFKLAMLYNSHLDARTNWNLIVAADWADERGVAEATRIIAEELHKQVGPENRSAVSRITVLRTSDPFVMDMARLHPYASSGGGVWLTQVAAGDVTEGAGYIYYAQPAVAA